MTGEVLPVSHFSAADKSQMFAIMREYYDNMDETVFLRDFNDKDYCLVLRDNGETVGFTTQKLLDVDIGGEVVHGVFSGDTIIRREYWGQTGLYQIFAKFWFNYAKKYDEFYWFLICKGYRTYGILPLLWEEFYPNYRAATPEREKRIIDAYASALYPDDYNPTTGVIEYKHEKDRLKPDVGEIPERRRKSPDIAFFCEKDPGYVNGNDLACLARFDESVLRPRSPERLGLR
ncbi:MAG: hypothetical protein K6B74_09895 [Ruminococcus sp.]|nr:hypothetical protein [Ruminococcus sp.]